MSRFLPKRFAGTLKAARTLLLAVVFCFCLPGGALRSQALDPPPNVPLPPDPVEENKILNQEPHQIEEQERARWAWISWICLPGGTVAVWALVHGVRIWGEHAKAMKALQDQEKRRQSRAT
jgi:hypothetical protein